jgi:hypothetical protein
MTGDGTAIPDDDHLISLAGRLAERAAARGHSTRLPAATCPLVATWGLPADPTAAAAPPAAGPPRLLDLRAEGQALVLAHRFLDGSQGPVYRDLDEPRRQLAISVWRERMAGAQLSARLLAHVLERMVGAGLPPREETRVAASISQDLEHARLCAAVASALGGDARLWLPPLGALPSASTDALAAELLGQVLELFCLGGTVSLAHLELERRAAYSGASPAVIVVLESLLAGKVQQARMGFRLVDELLPMLGPDGREQLETGLERGFARALVHHHQSTAGWLQLASAVRAPAAASRTAAQGAQLAWELAVITLDQVIVPALEARGLPARAAWRRALAAAGWTSPRHPRRPEHRDRNAA